MDTNSKTQRTGDQRAVDGGGLIVSEAILLCILRSELVVLLNQRSEVRKTKNEIEG